jgi:small subunit ribosomal protein S7
MPRRKRKLRRMPVAPDAVYNSLLVSKFINKLMNKGKKATAEKLIYGAMEILGERTKQKPLEVLEKALENARPVMEVKSRRVGGATYQVPVEVDSDRAQSLALRWIIGFSRGKSGKDMQTRLADELMDAYNQTGTTIKKREDTHKMAEANKAFAHFRW